ncbi:cytochrome P450 [Streptomyces sp. NPDC002680]|uniref:cytochrome P450 n=1 Tax=Streptomyces sp. NPDC002680 TaxID=3364659 RepID=UPI0036C85F63
MTDTRDIAEATIAEPFPWPRQTFDPPEVYQWLREERPVTRVITKGGDPAWLVTRYDDVRAVLADPRVSADINNPGLPYMMPGAKEPSQAAGLSFVRMDPPDHTLYRRLLSKNFMVKRVEAMRPAIQKLVDDTIDAMLASSDHPVDLVQALALPVPSTVLSWILGVRETDRDFFNKATEQMFAMGDGTDPEAMKSALEGQASLYAYAAELAAERNAADDPGDDILGQLVKASQEGAITLKDVVSAGFLLTVAGHDTTASMIALGTLTLLQHPDQLAELRAKPELIPDAVEELLRYLTIVHLVITRVAAEDIEIGGVVIPAGEGIIPLNFSANRDDAHYPGADRFDIHRNARDHFAFGYGVHQCLGQPLARVELHVIFETLLRRIPTLRLAVPVEEVPFKSLAFINGVNELPVTW